MLLAGCGGKVESTEPNAANRIHMTSKPAVVRIRSGCTAVITVGNQVITQWGGVGAGTGFFIHPDGYILTNAHVVDTTKNGDQACEDSMLRNFAIALMRNENVPLTQENYVATRQNMQKAGVQLRNYNRINDVTMQSGERFRFEIKAFGAPLGEGQDLDTGKDIAVLKIEVKNAPTLQLGVSGDMKVGDHVWVIGYPGAAESKDFDEKSALEPTTNDGAITSQKNTKDGTPILGTNTNTTHGNSGGPAINEKGEVIGQLTFRGELVNNQEVQGFNFLVPIDTAKEFVRQAGTENKQGPVDEHWRRGLEMYWRHEYSSAQKEFQTTLDLFGEHAEAKKLIAECKEQVVKGNDHSGLPGWVIALVIGGMVVVGAGGAGVAVMNARKKQQQPGQGYAGGYPAAPAGQGYAQMGQPGAGGYGASPSGGYPAPGGGYPAAPGPMQLAPTQAANYPQLGAAGPTVPGSPAAHDAPRVAKTMAYQGPPGGMGVKLQGTAGAIAGRELLVGGGIIIGRDPGKCQLVIDDGNVSGEHVWIGPLHGAIIARDLGSTNGTYVNDQFNARISEQPLKHGDVLTIGLQSSAKLTVLFPAL